MTDVPAQDRGADDVRPAPIVVADDDPLIRDYLQEVLPGAGYAVRGIASAREALAT